MDKLEELLECSICLGEFNCPKLLPSCQHTFCKACILTFVSNSTRNGVRFPLLCPECKTPFKVPADGFPTNVTFAKLLELPISSRSLIALQNTPVPVQVPVPPITVFTTHLNELPSLNLSERQNLLVSEAFRPGKFFAQLETIGTEETLSVGLEKLGIELKEAYSKLEKPPKLYQTAKQTLLGYYGVKHEASDDCYYRVRIIKENGDIVKLLLVDYGSIEFVRRETVIAPIDNLMRFFQPPYGIFCFFEDFNNVPVNKWKIIIEAKWITVDIRQQQNGTYHANFAGTSVDGEVAKKLKKLEDERRLLELPSSSRSQVGAVDGAGANASATATDFGGARPREINRPVDIPAPVAAAAPASPPAPPAAAAADAPAAAAPPVQQPRTDGENVREQVYCFLARHLNVYPHYTATRDAETKAHRVSITIAGLPEFDEIINCFEIEVGKNKCAKLVYNRLITLGYMTKDERPGPHISLAKNSIDLHDSNGGFKYGLSKTIVIQQLKKKGMKITEEANSWKMPNNKEKFQCSLAIKYVGSVEATSTTSKSDANLLAFLKLAVLLYNRKILSHNNVYAEKAAQNKEKRRNSHM